MWRALQKKALPFEDTPNSVLRRILKVNRGRKPKDGNGRLARGERTPQERFRQPILQALYEKGGAAKTAEVLDRVGEILRLELNDADRAKMKHGEVRWRNSAQWERNDMVEDGLLKKSSPRGIWELTDKGIKTAELQLR